MNKKTKLIELLIAILYLVIAIWNLADWITIKNQKDYIHNLETKLNIYEQSYNDYVLEDNLKQSDIYG